MKKTILLTLFLGSIALSLNAANSWSSRANFGSSSRRNAIGVSVGEKGYIGLGRDSSGYRKDFWEFDPATNSWSQRADFPGTARENAKAFSIGNICYVGTGYDGTYKNDFYAWDQSTGTWVQKTNFPGGTRSRGIAFSIGNKGYLGTGFSGAVGYAYKDFYEYDPSNDSWSQKADFPGNAGNGADAAVGFSIGMKGYVGTGFSKEFWEYDQLSDMWTRKTDFAGCSRQGAVGFSIGTKGYIGTGWTGSSCGFQSQDFWEWDQLTDTWVQRTNYLNLVIGAVGFSICNKGYIGTGQDYYGVPYLNNFAEYIPSSIPIADFNISQNVFCAGSCINFTDNSTNLPSSWLWTFPNGFPNSSTDPNPSNICFNTDGIYNISLTVYSNGVCPLSASKPITVNAIPQKPTITPSGNSFMSSASTGNQWYLNGNPISGATNQFYTCTSGTSGFLTVSVSINGCTSIPSDAISFACTVGIFENSLESSITIHPNPAKDLLMISIPSHSSENVSIIIIDMLGQEVQNQKTITSNDASVDVTNLQPGIYFLNVIANSALLTKRFVKL